MCFDDKRFLDLSKIIALVCFGVFFSTNFFGGNSLFFLSEGLQSMIKTIALILGVISGVIYFYIKSKYDDVSNMIKMDGHLYSKVALQYMKDNNISSEVIDKILTKGKKNVGDLATENIWTNAEGIKFLVYTDSKNHIIKIVS